MGPRLGWSGERKRGQSDGATEPDLRLALDHLDVLRVRVVGRPAHVDDLQRVAADVLIGHRDLGELRAGAVLVLQERDVALREGLERERC